MELMDFNYRVFKKLKDDSKLFLLLCGFNYKEITKVVVSKGWIRIECGKKTYNVEMG